MRVSLFWILCVVTSAAQLDQAFYDWTGVYPLLKIFKHNKQQIKNETLRIMEEDWLVWPERSLYDNEDGWKVWPLYGFGFWITKHCQISPFFCDLVRSIPNVRTASLSQLDAGTVLAPHQGWADLSNDVLRCHYGIIVPDGCTIGCAGQVVAIHEDDIVVFDDSKIHYAANRGDSPRIVLILDIERPPYVKPGRSPIQDTPQLLQFIESMRTYT